MILIKFIKNGSSSHIGSFLAGDLLRCDDDLAKYLVGIGVAEFVEQEPNSEPDPKVETEGAEGGSDNTSKAKPKSKSPAKAAADDNA